VKLRYGTNPQQAVACAVPVTDGDNPVRVLNGEPSFINMLDALNGWQLVRAASRSTGRPAAASFKHVSPAGAAVAGPLDAVTSQAYDVDDAGAGEITSAYLRARDADPKSSFGDFAAVSGPVDAELADVLARVVCDGIIAPGYEPGTVERLSRKKGGRFLVMEADEAFVPPSQETREVFGLRLTEERDTLEISASTLGAEASGLPDGVVEDLLLGLTVLRYTQSNSVCYVRGGATLGIGAGQQSRVDCTRLAGAKVDTWWLRRHPAIHGLQFRHGIQRQERINWQIRVTEGDLTPSERERLRQVLATPARELTADERDGWLKRLDGVTFATDGFLPFRDNVDHAHRHGVQYIAEPGGSIRSGDIEAACEELQVTLIRTGLRLFHH
jgi:phosphoribosylaminoimidazolecarboxamide formyltransferase/IMP cyclohydrolase